MSIRSTATARTSTSTTTSSSTSLLGSVFEGTGIDRERFLESYPDDVAVGHGPIERLGEIASLAIWDDLDQLVRTSPEGHLPIVYAEGQRPMAPPEAAEALRQGATVTIEEADGVHPVIARFSRALGRELGLPPDDCKALIVISPPGPAVPVHLDGIEVLVVHLRGEKVWRYSANDRVPYPDTGFFPSAGGAGGRGERAPLYDPAPLAGARPASSEVCLRPGSVLFLPRGFWHGTTSTETSVSITFRLRNPPAYRVVAEGIARTLAQRAAWRRPVPGIRGSRAWQERAERTLAPLLARLVDDLTADDLGASIATRHAGPLLVRDPTRTLELQADDGRTLLVVRGPAPDARPRALRLAPDLVATAGWIQQQSAFREAEAVQAADAPPVELAKLLQWLSSASALVR